MGLEARGLGRPFVRLRRRSLPLPALGFAPGAAAGRGGGTGGAGAGCTRGAWKNKGALLWLAKGAGGRGGGGGAGRALADDLGEQRRHGAQVLDVEYLPRVLHLQRLQLRHQQQQLGVEEPAGQGRTWLAPAAVPVASGTVAMGRRDVPALGRRVLVVDVALERQGHLLLEAVDEIPLGDTGVVWGRGAGGSVAPRGRRGVPAAPARRLPGEKSSMACSRTYSASCSRSFFRLRWNLSSGSR